MAAVFETFTGELRALIAATWADVVADGIFENEDIQSVSWDSVTPPIANITVPTMPISQDWGVANEVHQGIISLYWVGETGGDNTNQRAKAEAMRDALLTATFTNANVIDVSSIDWSDAVPVNNTFLEKNYKFRAAVVSVNVIVAAKVAT